MGTPSEHLRRWQEAGLLDAGTAGRIAAFEATAPQQPEDSERPTFTEALLYLGVVVIGIGVIVLTATRWSDLSSFARIVAPGAPAVAALLGGQWMRFQDGGALQRGASAIWAAAACLVAGTVAVALNEAGMRGEGVVLVSGLVMAATAFVLWLPMQRNLQVAAGAAAGLVLSAAAAAQTSLATERWAPTAAGLALAGMGLVALAAVELDLIRPRSACRLFTALAIAAGSFLTAAATPFGLLEVLPFVTGALLTWASVRRSSFLYTVLGIAAIFFGTLAVIPKHVSDPTLVAIAMMFAGLVLIVVVVIIARLRREGPPALANAGS